MKLDQVKFPCAGEASPICSTAARTTTPGWRRSTAPVSRRVHDLVERRWGVRDAAATARCHSSGIWHERTRCCTARARRCGQLDGRPVRGLEANTAGQRPRREARRGVLFGLASTIAGPGRDTTAEFDAFAARFPEHRTFTTDGVEQDLSFVPTVFDRLEPGLIAALVYRGGGSPALRSPSINPASQPFHQDRDTTEPLTFRAFSRHRIRRRMTTMRPASAAARAGDTAGRPRVDPRART